MYIRSVSGTPEAPPFYSGVTVPSAAPEPARAEADSESSEKPTPSAPIPTLPQDDGDEPFPRMKRAPLELPPADFGRQKVNDASDRPSGEGDFERGRTSAPLGQSLRDIEPDRLLVAAILIMLIAENGFDMTDDLPLILGLLAVI